MLRLWGEFTIELCVVVVVVVWQPLSRFGGSSAPSFDFRVDLEVPAKILYFFGKGVSQRRHRDGNRRDAQMGWRRVVGMSDKDGLN